jgi:hypothetical protein
MNRFLQSILVVLIFASLTVIPADAVDKKVYIIEKGEFLCSTFLDVKMLGNLLQQNDKVAIDKMFTSKKCGVIETPVKAYQTETFQIYAKFSIEGTTVTGWGLRKDVPKKTISK